MTEKPVSIYGLARYLAVSIVFALGIRLNMLSMENGNTSRTPATSQSRQRVHFGAFFRTSRRRIIARTTHPAVMLTFTSYKKTLFILFPPILL